MDLLILVIVIAVVAFIVNWTLVTLEANPTVTKLAWFVTVLVLLFFALRQLGIVIPNVIR